MMTELQKIDYFKRMYPPVKIPKPTAKTHALSLKRIKHTVKKNFKRDILNGWEL